MEGSPVSCVFFTFALWPNDPRVSVSVPPPVSGRADPTLRHQTMECEGDMSTTGSGAGRLPADVAAEVRPALPALPLANHRPHLR